MFEGLIKNESEQYKSDHGEMNMSAQLGQIKLNYDKTMTQRGIPNHKEPWRLKE